MLRACALEYAGTWDHNLHLVELCAIIATMQVT